MALDTSVLVNAMTSAATGLANNVWGNMKTFAIPELQKIAHQIVAIETDMLQPNPPYTQDGAKALMNMQVNASIGVIVAMTTLTLLAVQTALNQILAAISQLVNGAVHFALL